MRAGPGQRQARTLVIGQKRLASVLGDFEGARVAKQVRAELKQLLFASPLAYAPSPVAEDGSRMQVQEAGQGRKGLWLVAVNTPRHLVSPTDGELVGAGEERVRRAVPDVLKSA